MLKSILETDTVVVRNRKGKVIEELYIDKDLAEVAQFLIDRFIPVRMMMTEEDGSKLMLSIVFEHDEDIKRVKMPKAYFSGVGMTYHYKTQEERDKFVAEFCKKCYKVFKDEYHIGKDKKGFPYTFETCYDTRWSLNNELKFGIEFTGDEDFDFDDGMSTTKERLEHLNALAEKYGDEFEG